MLYLCFALYPEAAPFVAHFHCKRSGEFSNCQVFLGEDATIIVSGSGMLPSAVAVSHVLTLLPPSQTDQFANIGICGCPEENVPLGTVFLAPKITDSTTGRDYYPDLLYRHTLPERPVITMANVARTEDGLPSDCTLYDTEAAGVWMAAKQYFAADRLCFLKVVSDHCHGTTLITPEVVNTLMNNALEPILTTLQNFRPEDSRLPLRSPKEECRIAELLEQLNCSVTMENDLRKLLLYYELEHGGAISFAESILENYLKARVDHATKLTRKDGKQFLEHFRHACLH